jgi:integrase
MTHPTKTTLAVVPTTPDLAALAPLVDRAQGYASDARASQTLRAYARDWRAFVAWCAGKGIASLPSTPAAVAVYLATLADAGKRVPTIDRALAAIAHAHRSSGHEWRKGAPAITEVLSGIRRRIGVAQRKMTPIVDADLRALVGSLSTHAIGVRDRALITLGWFGAFRRSEIVALTVSDVTFTHEGLIVALRRSKTDQEGRGLEKGIPYAGDAALCPVRALRAWLDIAQISDGALFRSVNRGGAVGVKGLSDKAVSRIVKRAATAAGLDAKKFAGHSLRAGFATAAAMKGKSLDAIMRQTGHRSERVARGYIRHATLFIDNAASGLV